MPRKYQRDEVCRNDVPARLLPVAATAVVRNFCFLMRSIRPESARYIIFEVYIHFKSSFDESNCVHGSVFFCLMMGFKCSKNECKIVSSKLLR